MQSIDEMNDVQMMTLGWVIGMQNTASLSAFRIVPRVTIAGGRVKKSILLISVPVLSLKLQYMTNTVGIGLVEMDVSTNPMSTI